MNYYEHHLGDYMRDTAHLSMLEDGAYRRLMDAYYIKEAPIPVVLRDACRLVRAQSKQEREAVEIVLKEFFGLEADGWHHKRCETEIARYQDKQAKAKKSADARWNAHRSDSEGNANASADAMRTHSEGNALQTPVTSNQTPNTSSLRSERAKRASKKCPVDFELTTELRAWAVGEAPGVDVDRETAKFKDHAFKTARSDWPATWRNWMRTASERSGMMQRSPATGETAYQRQARENVAAWAPAIARKAPGAQNTIDIGAADVSEIRSN